MHEVLVNCLFKLAQEKKEWLCELAMTISVDLGCKATKQTNCGAMKAPASQCRVWMKTKLRPLTPLDTSACAFKEVFVNM